MYFPFLDNESRNLLQSTMDAAENYHDFVMRLNATVLNEEAPDLAIYFAIHHSALLLDIASIEEIGKKYGKILILRPNLFYARVHQGNVDDLPKIHEAADQVLFGNPPTWLAIETRFLKFEADLLQYPKTLYDTSNLEELERLIHGSPEFRFFESMLFDYYRERASRDGDLENKIRYTEMAIKSAEECDDIVRLAWYLRIKTDYLRGVNVREAKESLTRAYEIMESLGNTAGIASILLYLARLSATRGEYDLAIEQVSKAIQIREEMELPRGPHAVLLSTIYNAIGQPEAGLEWARYAEIDYDSNPAIRLRAIFNQIWSLIMMERTTEAQVQLDSIREEVMKSGLEILLAWLYFITGLLDVLERDFESATSNIGNALELYETKSSIEYALIFHYHLAKIEVYWTCYQGEYSTARGTTPWLALLEEKAASDDLPGFLGLVCLLKVKLAINQGDDDALRENIGVIRNLCNEYGLEFLDTFLESTLKQRE